MKSIDHDFLFFNVEDRDRQVSRRQGETKLGEELAFLSSFEDLKTMQANYVIFGIPEDIGIRANFGKPGASKTWPAFLSAFLNIQANQYNDPQNCVVLGQVDCDSFMKEAESIEKSDSHPQKKLGAIVQKIDKIVVEVIQEIVSTGKIPIIIGGGHNNSYGNIKGTSRALQKPVNILNIDAHTDLRAVDYRHSGNGFSYAKEEGFLNNYVMFGIHKNYTPQYIFDYYKDDEKVKMSFYEDLMGGMTSRQVQELERATSLLQGSFGIELDTDAIAHFNSSAKTPSGFSIQDIRHFMNYLKQNDIYYFHLAEAADSGDGQIGKALSYLVSDFIR